MAEPLPQFGRAGAMLVPEEEDERLHELDVGSRGINTAQRWLLGSVSTRVVQRAPCNVLVVG